MFVFSLLIRVVYIREQKDKLVELNLNLRRTIAKKIVSVYGDMNDAINETNESLYVAVQKTQVCTLCLI